MTRWEYRIEHGNPRLTAEALNKFGADGWELTAVASRGNGYLVYHFKRPTAGGKA